MTLKFGILPSDNSFQIFFEYLWFLKIETKQDYKDCFEKLVRGKAPKFAREVWNFRIQTTCTYSKIQIHIKDYLGLEVIRIAQVICKLTEPQNLEKEPKLNSFFEISLDL